MKKYLLLPPLLSVLLASCISISAQTEGEATPHFVTATLPPTMALAPRPTLTPSPAPTLIGAMATRQGKCTNEAVLLEDVTIPDNSVVPAGQVFTKTWKFKNTGTCPWTGFTIQYASGERMNAPASAPVADTPAGGTVDVSVDLTAPTADGTYSTYFSLRSAGGEPLAIGAELAFYVQVMVGTGDVPAVTAPPSASSGTPAYTVGGINIYCKYSYSENAAATQTLGTLINQARASAGLSALSLNPLLAQAAQGHSIDMACNNFLGHEGSDGSRIGALVNALGFGGFQEIIGIGSPQNVMDQWAADSGHWEVVLNGLATEMGVGYAYNAKSDFGGYFTVDLH